MVGDDASGGVVVIVGGGGRESGKPQLWTILKNIHKAELCK